MKDYIECKHTYLIPIKQKSGFECVAWKLAFVVVHFIIQNVQSF